MSDMNAIPAGASDILVDENDQVIAYKDEQEVTVICVPNCGGIKPNNQSAPGPIGNTQGIIVPQTAPEASGAGNSAPTPEVEQEALSIREQNKDFWKSLSDNSDSAAGKALSDLMGYVTDSAIASASGERWSEVISDETRANAQQYWQNQKDNADSFGTYYLAHLAGVLTEVGHEFIEGGAALTELALSDSLKQQVAMQTVQDAIEAASNPMAVLEGAKASIQAFMDLPGAEQADEALKILLTTLLPAGRLKKLIEPKIPRPDVDANVPESPRTTPGTDSKTSTETEQRQAEVESKPDSEADPEATEGKDGGYVDGTQKQEENEDVEGEVPDKPNVFISVDDFNRAANNPSPNTSYSYGNYTWTTDDLSRVSRIEGQATLQKHGRYVTPGEPNTVAIGKEGGFEDVGFHFVGDQFDGPINKLNVVPGSGRSITLSNGDVLKNLNLSRYKTDFEHPVANIYRETGNPVPINIETLYKRNNTTLRPDGFRASYQKPDGTWENVIFKNKAGG